MAPRTDSDLDLHARPPQWDVRLRHQQPAYGSDVTGSWCSMCTKTYIYSHIDFKDVQKGERDMA